MTTSDSAADFTGERLLTKDTAGRRPPSQDEIARLAYHLYETRGRRDGQNLDDWLSAEQQLRRQRR
ncbi:MAG TPA: DUF2934 domain-containing protein [Vicinamibacterales bacterium]|jgi:hypothetical protein